MSQTFTLPVVPATSIGRRALFLIAGAVAGLVLAALFLLAIGTATGAPQHAGAAVAAIVLATYAAGGVLLGNIIADSNPEAVG